MADLLCKLPLQSNFHLPIICSSYDCHRIQYDDLSSITLCVGYSRVHSEVNHWCREISLFCSLSIYLYLSIHLSPVNWSCFCPTVGESTPTVSKQYWCFKAKTENYNNPQLQSTQRPPWISWIWACTVWEFDSSSLALLKVTQDYVKQRCGKCRHLHKDNEMLRLMSRHYVGEFKQRIKP